MGSRHFQAAECCNARSCVSVERHASVGRLALRFVKSPLVWIGLAVSVGALFLAFRGLHWSEVAEAVAGAN